MPRYAVRLANDRRSVSGVKLHLLPVGIIAVSGLLASLLPASERAMVKITCPLDGSEFEAVQDFSGYAAGLRLDMKKMGAISSPWALARCPECGFPVYEKHPSPADIIRLKAIVSSERFRTEGRSALPWFALAVLREELKAGPFEIGWTYLSASWEAENEDRPEAYARAAQRAIKWFDLAATALQAQPERNRDRHLALYLPVELTRRLGDFAQAQHRLQQLPDMRDSGLDWLPAALQTQAGLIAARDKSPEGDSQTTRAK